MRFLEFRRLKLINEELLKEKEMLNHNNNNTIKESLPEGKVTFVYTGKITNKTTIIIINNNHNNKN